MSYTNWSYVEEYADSGSGRGIKAKNSIPAGTIIGIYDGKLESYELAENKMVEPELHKHIVQIMIHDNKLFGLRPQNVAGIDFINHSCNANVVPQDRIVLVAANDIPAGQNLTLDYTKWDLVSEGIACWCQPSRCIL
jgi:hypothetical protein